MPFDTKGMKKVGEIYQDLTHPNAGMIVLIGNTGYLIDPRTLHGRLLKWNTQKITVTQEVAE